MPSKEILDVLDAITARNAAVYQEVETSCHENAFGKETAGTAVGRFARGRIFQAKATQVELDMFIGSLRHPRGEHE
jgi:hypothetical protein